MFASAFFLRFDRDRSNCQFFADILKSVTYNITIFRPLLCITCTLVGKNLFGGACYRLLYFWLDMYRCTWSVYSMTLYKCSWKFFSKHNRSYVVKMILLSRACSVRLIDILCYQFKIVRFTQKLQCLPSQLRYPGVPHVLKFLNFLKFHWCPEFVLKY